MHLIEFGNLETLVYVKIISSVFMIALGILLLLRPMVCIRFVGSTFRKLFRLTLLYKIQDSDKFFMIQNPFWFRLFGALIVFFSIISILINLE